METGVKQQYGANDDRSVGENTTSANAKVNNDEKRKMLIDNIINKNPNEQNSQPLKSIPMEEEVEEEEDNNATQPMKVSSEEDGNESNMIRPFKSLGKDIDHLTISNEPVLSVHETAKKLNIIPESDDSSNESEGSSSTKKQRLDSEDDEDTVLGEGTILGGGNDDDDDDDGDDDDDDNDHDDDHDDDDGKISKWALKERLNREINRMRVFEVDLNGSKALSNIDLLEYIELLKVPKFRGVFMRDELPKRINPIECGIVNLSPHEHLGTHWVCYAKIYKTRIFFDSFGRKTPLELQVYMKTAAEFRNNSPVIQRNDDIVQHVNTSICGHLCLFVLTSLMRERLSFQVVMDQLNYAFDEQFYW
jgi:hypothetical protein